MAGLASIAGNPVSKRQVENRRFVTESHNGLPSRQQEDAPRQQYDWFRLHI